MSYFNLVSIFSQRCARHFCIVILRYILRYILRTAVMIYYYICLHLIIFLIINVIRITILLILCYWRDII